MYEFSFIDNGLNDFIRCENGKILKVKFNSYDEADDFIASGGLENFGWTNKGTKKYCWDEEINGVEVP